MSPSGEVRTPGDLSRMRQVARQLWVVFARVFESAPSGISAIAVDRSVRRELARLGLVSELVGYRGYPAHCALSPNAVAVHGIPDGREITLSDVFTADIAARAGGWVSDCAWTYLMPGAARRTEDEYLRAWAVFREACLGVTAGVTLRELARATEGYARSVGLSVIPEFVGHGIGRSLHEPPTIPFATGADERIGHRSADAGSESSESEHTRLVAGTVVNIEPVLTGGTASVLPLPDGWGYITADGRPTFHFELSLVVRAEGATILQLDDMDVGELPERPPFGQFR